MKALDPLEYEEAINEYIDKLQTIDPTRLAYYKDLSKLTRIILVPMSAKLYCTIISRISIF